VQRSDIYVSATIPVYRAEATLRPLCERLTEVLSRLGPYEIILVDDRSPDRSWHVATEIARDNPQVVAVRLSRNFGQHYAITAGLDLARGRWVVLMDCDLQDLPEEIPHLLEKALEGNDIVLARRAQRRDSLSKRFFSQLFYRVFNLLSGYRLDPAVGSYRIMSRTVVDAYRSMNEAARLFGGMIDWLGFETAFVDVCHARRQAGSSTYNLRALLRLSMDGMISFSNRPLYFSIALGAVFSVLAGGYGAFLITRFLLDPFVAVPGWLSTITGISFIGGIMLLNMGVLGIYIGRIYDQTKGRPLYVIDKIVATPNVESNLGEVKACHNSHA
jgi:glycosyltransferase involved in cell wall biosynthesis